MARTNATGAFGVKLYRGASGPPTTEPAADAFTEVAEITNLDFPELKHDVLPATQTGSPSGWKEKILGMKDGGSFPIEGHLVPSAATQGYDTGLLADWNAKTLRNFRVNLPDSGNSLIYFTAYVASFKPLAPLEGKLMFRMTLEISGVVDISDLDS